ncbi:tryptophan--tRNA ligase [Candidatus Peregrinibacteria bacterium]|nr:tryptophan--tRNA ligase [Candidatus Peregrinibacteria bacterium]
MKSSSKNQNNKRVLTGIKPSGFPHLGNYLGAMRPAIELQDDFEEAFYFIADLHSLTTVRNAKEHQEFIRGVTLDFLALGLNPQKTTFFRQSDLPEHAELAWIFSCITPFGLMERAHAWKDALAKKLKEPTVGLFTYPVLMAADILLYQTDLVPVGKDQKQHVEIARDIAEKFNSTFGETFKLPTPSIPDNIASIPGTDGEHKMSKSYKNTIEIFAPEETIRKQIMGIKTDSTPVESPKDPEHDTVFKLYALIANTTETENLRDKYLAGGFGYGDAKKLLAEKYLQFFAPAREKRIELAKDLGYLDDVLKSGAQKAKKIASQTLATVKEKVGLIL